MALKHFNSSFPDLILLHILLQRCYPKLAHWEYSLELIRTCTAKLDWAFLLKAIFVHQPLLFSQ